MHHTNLHHSSIFSLKSLLQGAAALAALTTVGAGAANAQETLDVVTVTAQKRVENQQEVPISVATLSPERLADIQAGGDDILGLAARVPGLYAESSNGRLAPRFYIRGLGNVDFDVAASQPVSIIIDDVVMENVLLKSTPLFDIEQTEVLRGPQGTLFGRNTPAGIVKFTTKKPTHETDIFLQASYGTNDTVGAQVGVGGSLIEDLLAVRFSGLIQSRSDYIDNGLTGEDDVLGSFSEYAGRAQLLYTPSETVSLLVNAHGRSNEGTSALFRANVLERGTGRLVGPNFDRDQVFFDGGQNNPQEADGWGVSGTLKIDFGGAELTSITAFETGSSSSLGDIDGGFVGPNSFFNPAMPPATLSPDTILFPAETQDSVDDIDQLTQELRLASTGAGPFKWQVGFYYFDSDLLVTTVGPAFPPSTTVKHENDSWAVFGQASYDVTEALTLTGGLRYTEDNRSFEAVSPPPFVTVNPTEVDDEDVSWDVSALYRVTPSFNLFARVADGFRGPTIQGRDVAFAAFSGAVDPQTIATSEDILSFEAGFKSQFFGDRARLNATAFYYTVDNQQFSIIGGTGNLNQVINADEGVGYGFEADAEYLVTDNLFVAVGFSYNVTEIQDETLATAPCGSGLCTVLDPLNNLGQALIDGNPFPNAPRLTFNAFAEYTKPYGEKGEFFINTDWALQGDTNIFLYEAAEFQTSGNFEGGLRIGYRHDNGRYEGAFFARNITDEENVRGAVDFNNLTAFVNEPRIVGFQLTLRPQVQ